MKQNKETIVLLECFMKAMDSMVETTEKFDRNTEKSIGEIEINGKLYQIAVSISSDKTKWLKDGELRLLKDKIINP